MFTLIRTSSSMPGGQGTHSFSIISYYQRVDDSINSTVHSKYKSTRMTIYPPSLMEIFDIFIVLFFIVFLHFWCKYRGRGHRGLPPGPRGWPIVGNLIQVILERRPFIFVVRDLRKKYGPIFTMQMGQRTMVIVTDAALIHEALVQKGHVFASRPPDSPIRLLFSVGKCAINSAEYGATWRALRRNFISEVVNPSKIRQVGWIRNWAFQAHLVRLGNQAQEIGFVHVMDQCRLTICSILICMCFGSKISETRIRNIETVLKDVMLTTAPKLPDFLPGLTPLFRRAAKEIRREQMECLVPLVRNRRSYLESGEPDMPSPPGSAYIDSLFRLEPDGRGVLGEDELVTLCSEVINAGTDTSATTVEWALLHLVQDPAMQEELYDEIVTVAGKDGPITEDHVAQMPYLAAIVKETFRRHPPSHFLLSHATTKETELGGYPIPAGVNVEFYTAWVTEDPNMWSDPDEFRPERFLYGDGVEVDVTGAKGVKMLPFGAGRRICPAMTLGTLHVYMLLARMIYAFKWLPVPEYPPDPTETFAFTVVMKNPLQARILPRSI